MPSSSATEPRGATRPWRRWSPRRERRADVLANGLALVIDGALARLGSAPARRYRQALVLGSLREDVARIPGAARVFEHLSFSHFGGGWLPGGYLPLLWPGPRFKVARYFRRALA